MMLRCGQMQSGNRIKMDEAGKLMKRSSHKGRGAPVTTMRPVVATAARHGDCVAKPSAQRTVRVVCSKIIISHWCLFAVKLSHYFHRINIEIKIQRFILSKQL